MLIHQLRQTEVGNFHSPPRVDQNVFRLDVSMDDPLVVRELQGLTDLGHDPESLFGLEPPIADERPEVHAIDEFHNEIEVLVRSAEIIDVHNVGMVEFGQSPRLARESFGEGGLLTEGRRKNLQRHEAIELPLPRLVDDAHAALAKVLENLELRKLPRECFQIGSRKARRRRNGRGGRLSRGDEWSGRRLAGCLALQARVEQALRAKAVRRVGRQLGSAFWALVFVGHPRHPDLAVTLF
jgi:hypothetical protein